LQIRVFKYLSPISIYGLAILAFTYTGFYTWLPMVYAWVLLPVTELFLKPDEHNLEAAEEELAKKNRLYVYMLYIIFHFLPWGQRRRAITGAVFLNGWRFS